MDMSSLLTVSVIAILSVSVQSGVVLTKARVESLQPSSSQPRSQASIMDTGFWYDVVVTPDKPLIGVQTPAHLSVRLKMGAQPKPSYFREVYLVLQRLGNGELRVVDWSFTTYGLCVSRSIATTYQIRDRLSELRRRGIVRWNKDCDW